MIKTNTPNIEGYQIIEYLGIVYSFRENYAYVTDEIHDLIEDLTNKAEKLGADAIISLTITSASTYSEDDYTGLKPDMIAYGTAVKIQLIK